MKLERHSYYKNDFQAQRALFETAEMEIKFPEMHLHMFNAISLWYMSQHHKLGCTSPKSLLFKVISNKD